MNPAYENLIINKLNKPKVVFVASDPPMPPTGGGNRTYNFVRAIAAAANCSLFTLFPIIEEKLPVEILKLSQQVTTATKEFKYSPKSKFLTALFYLRLIFIPWSFSRAEFSITANYFITNNYSGDSHLKKCFFYSLKHFLFVYAATLYKFGFSLPVKTLERYEQFKELEKAIEDEINCSDALWIDFSSLLPYFREIKKRYPELVVFCNAHNIEYRYLERLSENAKTNLSKRWYQLQSKLMREAEIEGLANCDLIITCSETDKIEILNNLIDARIQVIPNGVDTDFFVPNPNLSHKPSLLFTGTMGYKANQDAVEYFISKVFPLLLEKLPNCSLIIAGANAKDALAKYAGINGIEIISSPEDMRPIYDRAWIVIVPLKSGSGTRLKILEAMAMEKPIVSTLVGAEGIPLITGKDIMIADGEVDFCLKIMQLIENNNLYTELSSSVRQNAIDNYDWKTIRETISKTFIKTLCFNK